MILAWTTVAVLAVFLVVQRYSDALASGVGMDLGFWLDAAELARTGRDPYGAEWYTYSPLTAWMLIPFADRAAAMAFWTAFQLCCGLVAIGCVVAAHRRILPTWRAPLIAAVAVVTLLYSNVLSLELFLGQNQQLIMALLAIAVLVAGRWPALSGAVLGVAALVKTWPVLIGVWLIRAGARHRLRAVLAWVGTMAVFAVVMMLVLGPSVIGRLVERTSALREQPLAVYSVWYFARQWPASGGDPIPFDQAPLAGQSLTLVLAAFTAGLIVLALMRPGTASLAMWNITGAVVLLLPVSHAFYRLLILPLLWVWCAELIGRSGRLASAASFATLSLWWLLSSRLVDPADHSGWLPMIVVVATLVAVAVSTVLAAARSARPISATRAPVAAAR